MSEAAIEGMMAAERALIAALDAHDIDALEAALPRLAQSIEHVRLAAVWQQTPSLIERLKSALALADAARTRVRYLADHNQQRLDLLAAAAGRFDIAPGLYARP
jgi:hypothetical protein